MEIRQVQIKFTEDTEFGRYTDAIYVPLDAYQRGEITEEQIVAQKAERVNRWTDMVRNPPAPVVLSDADLLAQTEQQLQELEQQRIELEARTVELTSTRTILSDRITRIIEDPIVRER